MQFEHAVVSDDRAIKAVQRNFKGQCPEHGEVFGMFLIGNHTTIGEAKAKRQFTKQKRLRVKRLLPKKELKIFNAFIHGNYSASAEQIAHWKRLTLQPTVSDISNWLGNKN